jgi:hypothetical protein
MSNLSHLNPEAIEFAMRTTAGDKSFEGTKNLKTGYWISIVEDNIGGLVELLNRTPQNDTIQRGIIQQKIDYLKQLLRNKKQQQNSSNFNFKKFLPLILIAIAGIILIRFLK